MVNPLISVIVPVYKVERYLPRCIESILGQTYTNFELILVDDGTPDRSGVICDRYAEKDSRIRVIHKENGGVSTARNIGIDTAKGEWITFIDSDDWVKENYLDVLVSPLSDEEFTLVVGRLEWRYLTIGKRELDVRIINVDDIAESDVLHISESMEFHGPCYKLFSTDVLRGNNIRFPEGIALAEDTIFVNRYLKHCHKICMTGKTIYYYNRLNESSVTAAPRYFDKRSAWDAEYIDSYIEWIDVYKTNETLRKRIVSQKAIGRYLINARSLTHSFGLDIAKQKIAEISEYYEKWIDFSNEEMDNIGVHIKEKNVDAIYDLTKPVENKHIYLKARRIIKKIIRPFIEKYRDGLIKFKF